MWPLPGPSPGHPPTASKKSNQGSRGERPPKDGLWNGRTRKLLWCLQSQQDLTISKKVCLHNLFPPFTPPPITPSIALYLASSFSLIECNLRRWQTSFQAGICAWIIVCPSNWLNVTWSPIRFRLIYERLKSFSVDGSSDSVDGARNFWKYLL